MNLEHSVLYMQVGVNHLFGEYRRGPCPGLNALANHGYLPHNGVVGLLQIVSVVNEIFGITLNPPSMIRNVSILRMISYIHFFLIYRNGSRP